MSYLKLKLHKLLHWEFWSMQMIYYPIFPVWFYYALKARSFFFFNAANPSIKNGGMAMESKKEIYDLIPQKYIPKTILLDKNIHSINEVLPKMQHAGITFPMIAKPDIGMKSFGVELIKNIKQLQSYLNKSSHNFLIQEFIKFPNEIGVFYVKHPNEKKGKITGIVAKEFLTVTGNGNETIEQLIKKDPRSFFQLSELQTRYGNKLNDILEKGKKFVLVPYGSHTRGAKFIDISDKICEKLEATINDLCSEIPGFYFGRLDIFHTTIDDLAEGKNFKIIEINGAGSEPTHIYDPNHSLIFAWKEIIKHWKILYQISKENKKKGHKYLSYKDGIEMLRANSILEAQLKLI